MTNDLPIQRRYFERLAELEPDDPVALFMLADVYQDIGEAAESRRAGQLARGRADRQFLPVLLLLAAISVSLALLLQLLHVQSQGLKVLVAGLGLVAWLLLRPWRHRRLMAQAARRRSELDRTLDLRAQLDANKASDG